MKTVIGMFDQKDEAIRAYSQLLAEGYARADMDILTNDDRDDTPKLARMHSWVPEPDLDIYLAGVRDGGTIVTANVGDTAVARAASILGSFKMINISDRAAQLASKAPAAARAACRGNEPPRPNRRRPAVPKQTPAKASGAATDDRADRRRQERQRARSDRGGSGESASRRSSAAGCASTTS